MIIKTIIISFFVFLFIVILISDVCFLHSLYKECLPFKTKDVLSSTNVLSTHWTYILCSDRKNPYLMSIIDRYLYGIYKLRICDNFLLISRFNYSQKVDYQNVKITEDIDGRNLTFTLNDKQFYVSCNKKALDIISTKL